VLGSATANIQVTAPSASAAITSPVEVQGTSTAFEATVNVDVREDDNESAIGTGVVMGGSMGEMGPFTGSVTFATPSADYGALVFYTLSAENGQVWEASVLRIEFAA
jgi:hypothetical protein